MLPDFIIIGAMKCGTTSLYRYLKTHSQIGGPRIKETNFFIKEGNTPKQIEWYKSQFTGNYPLQGEASPNYSKAHLFQGVPRRIHQLIPDVKLLYILRDPVERIISHYTHNYGKRRESGFIEELLKNQQKFNHYVMTSRYYWQIQQFLEYFSKQQILIISLDKLKTDRESALQKVFRFLEVDSKNLDEEQLRKKIGTTSQKTKTGKVAQYFFNNPLITFLKKGIPADYKRRFKRKILPPLKKPSEVDPVLKSKLRESLKSDVEALRSFTGRPFSEWSV